MNRVLVSNQAERWIERHAGAGIEHASSWRADGSLIDETTGTPFSSPIPNSEDAVLSIHTHPYVPRIGATGTGAVSDTDIRVFHMATEFDQFMVAGVMPRLGLWTVTIRRGERRPDSAKGTGGRWSTMFAMAGFLGAWHQSLVLGVHLPQYAQSEKFPLGRGPVLVAFYDTLCAVMGWEYELSENLLRE